MKNIYQAISNFQQECPVILKDTDGYGYKYADLPAIYKVIMPLLKKNGLGFTQILKSTGIKTIVFHIKTGKTLEGFVKIPQDVQLAKMNVYQVMGSAYTYYRRYALSAMLGIVTDKDNDMAGEHKPSTPKKAYPNKTIEKKEVPDFGDAPFDGSKSVEEQTKVSNKTVNF